MQMKIIGVIAALLAAAAAAVAQTPAPSDAKLYFISPQNGATIEGPVTIRFGLLGVPWRHLALNSIREATTRELSTFGDGGLGLRFNPVTGTTAYKVRGGPALVLELANGRTALVSVDDPETGAGLVNDLLAQRITRID